MYPIKYILLMNLVAKVASSTEGGKNFNGGAHEVQRLNLPTVGGAVEDTRVMIAEGENGLLLSNFNAARNAVGRKKEWTSVRVVEDKSDQIRRKTVTARRKLGDRHEKSPIDGDAEDDLSTVPEITEKPSQVPSASPTRIPSTSPSELPTSAPTLHPSTAPSTSPSAVPSTAPSAAPTLAPSMMPSNAPSSQPTGRPSEKPSAVPTFSPSFMPSDGPSVSPSDQPSPSPSAAQSDEPSSQPTEQPTTTPSTELSVSPSPWPSLAPTDGPSSQPSAEGSDSPSSQPSAAPSVSTSSTPSQTPSTSPSSRPSEQPSKDPSSIATEKCTLEPNGSFGDVTSSSEEVLVAYDYEVETNTAVTSDMIPTVERAINDVLLPVLFSDSCSDDNNVRRALLEQGMGVVGLRGVRRLQTQMVALSPNPPDEIQGDTCSNEGKIEAGNSCFVVSGRLSVYTIRFGIEEEEDMSAVLSAIRLGMEEGILADAHPSIARLFFVERNNTVPKVVNPNESRFVDIQAGGGNPFPWAIAGSLVSLVIVGTVVAWSKMRRKQHDLDEDIGEEEDAVETGSLSQANSFE
eukprot:CAMPEP_0197448436 /NCGR_PEP_ID=MMETSP1175-20131217/17440_1 /TAXON_ID=1003142 /ORGANISM="Triceratium dubium, Strain CCMP147" /LENGTH=571 /DNA_ID=CAMNT_0042980183 /DNA_START=37 /DNA_END=1752 /DNA_ORIENTATION=+